MPISSTDRAPAPTMSPWRPEKVYVLASLVIKNSQQEMSGSGGSSSDLMIM